MRSSARLRRRQHWHTQRISSFNTLPCARLPARGRQTPQRLEGAARNPAALLRSTNVCHRPLATVGVWSNLKDCDRERHIISIRHINMVSARRRTRAHAVTRAHTHTLQRAHTAGYELIYLTTPNYNPQCQTLLMDLESSLIGTNVDYKTTYRAPLEFFSKHHLECQSPTRKSSSSSTSSSSSSSDP